MADPLKLEDLKGLVEELAEQQLGAYTATLEAGSKRTRKDVNDALWGTMLLSPMDVAVLDSPLLQRLRYIRQRGAAHWVYPGAVHTRFEHLLGAMHLVRSMAEALNQAAKNSLPEEIPPPISEATMQVLRLAMMLREAAQMAFSQVAEGAVSESNAFALLPKALSESLRTQGEIPGEDVSFVQIVGYYIAQSPAVRRLLALLLDREASWLKLADRAEKNVDEVVRRVSLAIIGRRIDDKLLLIHELVAGPFDAERVDALMRDARFAGLPTVLDEQRLLQKLAMRKMRLGEMPEAIVNAMTGDPSDDAWIFGVKASAAAVLDELQLARMLATAKVYQHPKVLAVEQMLRSVISSLIDAADMRTVLRLLFLTSDDALLGMSARRLAEELGVPPEVDEQRPMQRVEAASQLLAALRERRLWVRAVQFPAWRSALDGGLDTAAELETMRSELRHVERGPILMNLVRDEAFRILTLRGEPVIERHLLDTLISARSLESTSSETEAGRAYILQSSRQPYQFSQLLSLRGSWFDQYNAGQPRDHVFCPPELADAVFVAFERVARMEYQTKFPESSVEASKRDPKKVLELKRELKSRGYWSDAPYDIRPLPERLSQTGVKAALKPFHDLRTSYLAPVNKLVGYQKPPVEDLTREWLAQFDDDKHVNCAMRLLANVRMLNRDDLNQALATFLPQHPEFKDSWVAPFGTAKDSGSIQAYFAGDARLRGLVADLGGLGDYVSRGVKRPVIFVDDVIGSGGQACDVLAAMMGRDDLRRDLGEKREKLPADQAAALRDVPVAFLFVAGWQAGIEEVRQICPKLGLKAEVFALLTDENLPFADRVLAADPPIPSADAAAFLRRCTEIGEQLIRSEPRDKPLDESKVAQRALGYGNRGMLVVTPFNVPSHTLTALWLDGTVDGLPWSPLFPRRKKT